MYESFAEFFEALWQTKFGFKELWEWVADAFKAAFEVPVIYEVRQALSTVLAPLSIFVTVVLLAVAVIVACYGKKIMPVIKFTAFAIWGFVVGACFVTPLFDEVLAVPAWLCAVVVSVAHAILYRYVYLAFFSGIIAFLTYVICYTGFTFTPPNEHSVGMAVLSLIIAAVAVVLAFVFKKYVEMVGTAALGGYFFYFVVRSRIYDLASLEFLSGAAFVAPLVVISLVAVPGLLIQLKMRKKY